MRQKPTGSHDRTAPLRKRQKSSGSFIPTDRKDTRPAAFSGEAAEDGERIAKRLARTGVASRREAETMIAAGRIAVNGRILTTPAVNVKKTDVITVDGKLLPQAERTRLWLYHKPAGLVTTARDPEGRPTVFENLPDSMPRVLSVGRLDINTEGLLLLTNDGGLSRILELPSTGWTRHYRVRVHGKVTQAELDTLKDGIAVDGVFYGAVQAVIEREQGSNMWLSVTLQEGKNREIKNILGTLGLAVTRLIRVSFGPFQLADLAEGMVREIRGRTLRDQLGERLIAEANADFDAPVLKPFSNMPVAHAAMAAASGEEGGREALSRKKPDWISSGSRGRPPVSARGADEKQQTHRKRGGANVWMAPGARPARDPSRNFDHAPDRGREGQEEEGQGTARPNNRYKEKFAPHAASGRPARGGFAAGRRNDTADGYNRKRRMPEQASEQSDNRGRQWSDRRSGDGRRVESSRDAPGRRWPDRRDADDRRGAEDERKAPAGAYRGRRSPQMERGGRAEAKSGFGAGRRNDTADGYNRKRRMPEQASEQSDSRGRQWSDRRDADDRRAESSGDAPGRRWSDRRDADGRHGAEDERKAPGAYRGRRSPQTERGARAYKQSRPPAKSGAGQNRSGQKRTSQNRAGQNNADRRR